MKIVFDTSVLLAAFLSTTGLSAQVFRKALRKRHSVIVSSYILEEAKNKMSKKLNIPRDPLNRFLAFLRKNTEVVNPISTKKISFSDKKDIPILELVQFSQAHYLVTWDKKLLNLKKYEQSLILTPKELLRIL